MGAEEILTSGSAIAILAWLVLALINGWLVPKSVVSIKDEQIVKAQKDAEFWRDIALKGTNIAEEILANKVAEVQGKKP